MFDRDDEPRGLITLMMGMVIVGILIGLMLSHPAFALAVTVLSLVAITFHFYTLIRWGP